MPISIELYQRAFRREFSIEEDLTPTTSLFDDLGFDSIGYLRLLVWTEDLADVLFALGETPLLLDVQGAYDYYVELCGQTEARVQ